MFVCTLQRASLPVELYTHASVWASSPPETHCPQALVVHDSIPECRGMAWQRAASRSHARQFTHHFKPLQVNRHHKRTATDLQSIRAAPPVSPRRAFSLRTVQHEDKDEGEERLPDVESSATQVA
jgi:hypothetical protein